MSEIKKLKYFVDGKWLDSKTNKYMDCYNPSTGEVIAQTPCCTPDEVEQAIQSAKKAFASWSMVPVFKRVQVLFKLRNLIEQHLDELTTICATENGKVWSESEGDILKVREPVEFAAAMPNWMKGESLWDTSTGYDCVTYREPVGVFGRNRSLQLPRYDPHGLDGSSLYRGWQHHGHQGGFHGSADRHEVDRVMAGSGIAGWCFESCYLQQK